MIEKMVDTDIVNLTSVYGLVGMPVVYTRGRDCIPDIARPETLPSGSALGTIVSWSSPASHGHIPHTVARR